MFFGHLLDTGSSLFEPFDRLQRELEQIMNAGLRGSDVVTGYPPINIGTTPDAVHVYVFASGLDPASIDVELQQNVLSIEAERKTGEPKENETVALRERFNGRFRRVLTLPDDVDPDQVSATYRNGVLHIRAAKKAEARTRHIEVQS
ncbi:MAG: Hsp20/alpha crystallin family protein [Gammaproteobacteria bacterium]|nr:MAG: Hsp20/alpha crystallin family protein [Gammaproteobacteria bacterium]